MLTKTVKQALQIDIQTECGERMGLMVTNFAPKVHESTAAFADAKQIQTHRQPAKTDHDRARMDGA